MTLILSTLNLKYSAQVSDRQLSTGDGLALDEFENKAIVFLSQSARFVIGMAGFFGTDKINMRRILMEVMREQKGKKIEQKVRDLALGLEAALNSFVGLDQSTLRTSILITGYLYDEDTYQPYLCLISNFESFDSDPRPIAQTTFSVHENFLNVNSPNFASFQAIGGVSSSDIDQSAGLDLAKQEDPNASIAGLYRIVQEKAPLNPGIGTDCSGIVLFEDRSIRPSTCYLSLDPSPIKYYPSLIIQAD